MERPIAIWCHAMHTEYRRGVIDFQTGTWNQHMLKFYDYDLEGTDVLIGTRIAILPGYRGQGIAPKNDQGPL